jgi:hypothetical protein
MFQQSPRGAPDFGTAKRPDADTPAKSGTSKPTDANQPANPGTIGSLQDSLRDLNAIRDANVTRVQKDVCPPEMAARMAELRTQIGRHEAELRGEIAAGQTLKTRPKANPLDTAANWFKAAVPAPTEGTSTKDQLIDSVLPNAGATERRTGKAEPTVEDPARRKTIEQEIARGKAELEQLRGACAAAKH